MRDLVLDDLHIDSIVDLLKASFTMEDWEKMIIIADKLHSSTIKIEKEQQLNRIHPKRHLVYYYGFSQLSKGIALQNQGKYSESKMLIEKYSDLSWLDDGSEEAKKEVQFFKLFAKANMLAVNVLEGHQEYFEPYIEFLRQSKVDELIPGLLNIIEAGMRHNINIHERIDLFNKDIDKAVDYYTEIRSLYLTKFFYKLSLYYLLHQDYDVAIRKILQGLEICNKLNDINAFKKFSVLFEVFRKYATEFQRDQFNLIMRQTLKGELNDEKNLLFHDHFFEYC